MKYKTEHGMEVELTEKDMMAISKMQDDHWDRAGFKKYLEDMCTKAHTNTQMISEDGIDSEDDLKDALADVLQYGTYEDAADMIVETIEYVMAWDLLKSMKKSC